MGNRRLWWSDYDLDGSTSAINGELIVSRLNSGKLEHFIIPEPYLAKIFDILAAKQQLTGAHLQIPLPPKGSAHPVSSLSPAKSSSSSSSKPKRKSPIADHRVLSISAAPRKPNHKAHSQSSVNSNFSEKNSESTESKLQSMVANPVTMAKRVIIDDYSSRRKCTRQVIRNCFLFVQFFE